MSSDTTQIPVKASDTIQIEAASWIAQLDKGKLSATDRLALAEWLARSPKHNQTLRHLAKVWGGIDHVLDEALLPRKTISILAVLKSWMVVRPMHFAGVSSAILTLFVMAGVLTMQLSPNPNPNALQVYHAAKGEQVIRHLKDGSVLHLNTDTLVEVQFTKKMRTLRLLRGEAYFDVAHDTARPFHVYAGDGRVQAVGTAFSVKLEGTKVDVVVTEGKVRFDTVETSEGDTLEDVEQAVNAETPVFMKAGQSMIFENQIQLVASNDDFAISKKTAWKRGEMVFNGDSFEKVVEEMNRYSSREIVITDSELRSRLISGTFKSNDINAILGVLELSLGIKVDESSETVVYLSQ